MSDDKMELRFLAMYIESALHAKGITQIKMGEDIGLQRTQVSDILNAKCNPSFSRVMKIFRYLGISPDAYELDLNKALKIFKDIK